MSLTVHNQVVINLQFTTIKDPSPDFIYEGLAQYSKDANTYQPQPKVLLARLSAHLHVPTDMIYLTAGIDEAIQIFAKTYGQNAYVFTPTYSVYADVEEFGGRLTRIPSIIDTDYVVNTETKPDATLIFLANPNNPAGFTSQEYVLRLIQNNPQAKVVIDEAYGEFADSSVIHQVAAHPNLVVFRSFSKAYGMAGNRIGYMIAHPEVIATVKPKTQWANVSYLSVGAACVAMDHEEHFKKMREAIVRRRDDIEQFLTVSGFSIIPSKINCALLKFSSEAKGTKLTDFLKENHVVVSHGNGASNIGLDKSFVRIAIGTEEQMEVVKQLLQEYEL